jgi:hypothetical protein
MAAGLVSHNVTTASGVTFAVKSWVPDTTAPDVGAIPVHVAFDSSGSEVLTAAQVVSLLGKLDTLHTDAGTTLHADLGTLHTDLANNHADELQLHTDIATTLHGDLTSTNTKLDTLHTDLGATQRFAQDTSQIANGAASLTPKFAKISVSSSGANTIVAAVTSKKIRVLAWDIVANAAVNFKWQSHGTPTDLTGLYYMAGQGNGVARAFCPVGYFETLVGEALDINLSGAVAVGGVLTYVEV